MSVARRRISFLKNKMVCWNGTWLGFVIGNCFVWVGKENLEEEGICGKSDRFARG